QRRCGRRRRHRHSQANGVWATTQPRSFIPRRARAVVGGRFSSRQGGVMTRTLLWPVLAIGALLVVLPFAFQMPSRTAAGDRMMKDFQPVMGAAHVQKTADYYNKVFVPLGTVATQFTGAATNPQMQ